MLTTLFFVAGGIVGVWLLCGMVAAIDMAIYGDLGEGRGTKARTVLACLIFGPIALMAQMMRPAR